MRARSILIPACVVLLAGCGGTNLPASPSSPSLAPTDCLSMVGGIDLQRATIPDIQAALTAGTVTSVQLVQAYAARIKAFDWANGTGAKLNSVQEMSATALAQASALDAERAAGHVRGPLHGIPILLKDNVDTKDEPTTAGSIALATNRPPDDATLALKLREAGAIILGKTHMSEFAQWISLNNPNGYSSLGGQVVNAYNGGDPSGSSSGSGVAGSMAFAAATIGTETQGSILGPSDANSLVGVKPTVGLVSRAGVIPLAASFDTPGPMGRSVEDVAVVLDAIAGTDAKDAATADATSHLPRGGYASLLWNATLSGVRLGYDRSDTNAMFAKARDNLTRLGAVLVAVDPPLPQGPAASGPEGMDNTGTSELTLIFNEFKAGINDYLANTAGPGLPVSDLTGIIAYNQQHPDRVKYGQDLLIGSDATPGSTLLAGPAALAAITAQKARIDQMFADNQLDAMVGPGLAYYQGGAEAGYPTVIVPMGYTGHDPHGLSFMGQAWSEAKLLQYASVFENATHARRAPTDIRPAVLEGSCPAEATHPEATATFASARGRLGAA